MKKLAIFAFAAFSSLAFAGGGNHGGGGNDEETTTCESCPAIDISGNSLQAVAATSSVFLNAATGKDSYAQQNVSSNSGNVTVKGGSTSIQLTSAKGSVVANLAMGEDAYASQNVSSNIGNVVISGNSLQMTALRGSGVINVAAENTRAIQNVASNNGCSTCQPSGAYSY
jgi:hypothetical protein